MDKLEIGQRPLRGEIRVSGAKNAALPILCAGLLCADTVSLGNVPDLQDVRTTLKLLRQMGMKAEQDGHAVTLDGSGVNRPEAPYELVKTMRASIPVLGPLVARFGEARVSLPGGCAIGARPVDQHIKGLQAMGAEIAIEHGFIHARAKRLKGARVVTDMITVTGTENLLMAATLADGETVLENAAREPEVTGPPRLLVKMGAQIEGIGTDRLVVRGVERLHGASHDVVADRIEAGTFLRGCRHARRPDAARHQPGHSRRGAGQAARSRRAHRQRRGLDPRRCRSARARSASVPRSTRPSRPTCRRSSWPWTRSPKVRRASPRPSSRTASCMCRN